VKTDQLSEPVVLNTLPWHREEIVKISDTESGIASGSGVLLAISPIDPDGKRSVSVQETSPGVFVMQNDDLRVIVECGCITSMFDLKNDREVMEKGRKGNKLVIFDDIPLFWEAWDVEVYHLGTRRQLEYGTTKVHEQNSHQVTLVTDVKISEQSSARSFITLSAALSGRPSQVDCTAEVDWHEDSKFLKVEFPVDIVNPEASYETAYGITKRPTHYNTSWDMAKFEVCCHKFADLSEHNYGVSILNDSKYGFATAGKMMRLSLLRSPKAPDAHADMGHHVIRWAILPHKGDLSSLTVRAAYAFNDPLSVVHGAKTTIQSHASTAGAPIDLVNKDESASLILDTIKRGNDDEELSRDSRLRVNKGRSIVVRVYESLGGASRGTIKSVFDVKRATKTNILEDELEELPVKDNKIAIKLRPFEVATYKLEL